MIVPKLPPDLRADKILPFLHFLDIQRADLSRRCALGSDVSHSVAFFLQDYNSCGGVFVVAVLVDELSFVLLIDAEDVLPWGFHFHIQVC